MRKIRLMWDESIPIFFLYTSGNILNQIKSHFFLKNQELEDAWRQFFVESQDRPDLYGTSVRKNAFILFLLHIFHSRREEFLSVVSDFFRSIAAWNSHPLPIGDLNRDLQNLGFCENEVNMIFL